jgi:lysophospholipase L1-like esterase
MKSTGRGFIAIIFLLGFSACQAKPKLGIDIPVRIMPMGDSITEGMCDSAENCHAEQIQSPTSGQGVDACGWSVNPLNPNETSYRAFLRDKLLSNKIQMTYVGSVTVSENLAHEGHAGWTVDDLDFCVQNSDWLDTAQPDMILLHIGTNDLAWSMTPGSTDSDLVMLIEHIYARLPNTTYLLIAQILPINSQTNSNLPIPTLANDLIAKYNAQIPNIVDHYQEKGYNVFSVDMAGVIQSDADLYDGVHPTPAAFQRMADAWYARIVEVLKIKE